MKLYMLLHGHHENPNGCPLSLTYQSLIERKREIKSRKPKGEQTIRLALIRNVKPQALPVRAQKAWAAYAAACAARDAALDAWAVARDAGADARDAGTAAWTARTASAWNAARDAARDAWYKARGAYDDAQDAFFASLTPEQWDRWHKKICKHPDCKWTAEHPSIF